MQRRAPKTNGRSDSDDLLQIGEAAERAGLSIRTLRHWDDVGLVIPTARSGGGFRLYSSADLRRLMVAKSMKPMGFTLEEMGTLLALVEEAASADEEGVRVRHGATAQLEEFACRTVERIQRIERDHRDASTLLEQIRASVASTRDQRSEPWRRPLSAAEQRPET